MALNASISLAGSERARTLRVISPRVTVASAPDAPWVERVRMAALVVFPALIALCVVLPNRAGRVFWTVSIAALPLFFVIAGYHRWRRICPLAFTAQISTRLGVGGRRRAGKWLQAHAYHVSFGFLAFSLWLRLIATNGDGYALAVFLVALALVALATDSLFTGKTWCNYVCPIGFVEKIYTEPRNLRATPNSECRRCTACKPSCPDINEENTYWKEALLPAKRDVYFAFPGLVFAFYFYYYLQAGTWEYYFGGRWTNEIGLVRTAFLPGVDAATAGLYFWPAVPRAIAAAFTLLAGAALSFSMFSTLETVIRPRLIKAGPADQTTVRHVMFTLAAFTAFVTFYSFAGAPTLRLVPGLPHFFQLLVVTTATLFLVRRLFRRRTDFVQETLARQILAKWPWADVQPPRDLREAFLIHRIRSESHEAGRARAVQLYKDAVRETVNSGIVSRVEVHRLEAIRDQMRISTVDHERIMAELAEEERGLPAALVVSPEKHLQLETYTEALAVFLARRPTTAAPIDAAAVRALREEYAVSEEEHAAVLDRLVRRDEGVATHLLDVPAVIETAFAGIDRVEPMGTPAARFLTFLLRRRAERAANGLLRTIGSDADLAAIHEGLLSRDPVVRAASVAALGSRVSPTVAERLTNAHQRAQGELVAHPDRPYCLRCHFSSPDPYIRAAALYLLESLDEATEKDYAALEGDEHPVVQETLNAGRLLLAGDTPRLEPTTIVKMIGLKAIDLFATLDPEDLADLAREGQEAWFLPDEALCRQGEMGHEVFVLLDGEVSIRLREGDEERVVATEGPGSVIGELAVLDPAPRPSTVIASPPGVRTLRLDGAAFRRALGANPAVSEVIIRMLARRLRAQRFPGDVGS